MRHATRLAILAFFVSCATASSPLMLRTTFEGACVVDADALPAYASSQATPRPRASFTASGNIAKETVSVFFYREDFVRVLGDEVEWMCGTASGVATTRTRWTQSTRGPDTVEESADWVVPVSDFERGCSVGRERWGIASAAEKTVVRPLLSAMRDPATRCP